MERQAAREIEHALDALSADGLVAFPTETVWGVAARAESPGAMARLRELKGRSGDKAVSLLVDYTADPAGRLAALGVELDARGRRLVDAFWPGPLTLVVRASVRLAPGVAAADGSIGLRCSPHPMAAALARGAFERGLGPLTATSLNRSGEPPARDAAGAALVLAASPAGFVLLSSALGEAGGSEPSTVVRLTGSRGAAFEVLREGAISRAALEAAVQGEPGPDAVRRPTPRAETRSR
jgi:L-threonylcarbamoyladenylate synthase